MTLSRFSACTIIVSLLLLIIYTKNIIYLESTHEISWSDHQIYRIYGKNVPVGVPSLQNLKLYNLCSTQDIELKLSPDFTYYNVFSCPKFVGCSQTVTIVVTKIPPEKGVSGTWSRTIIQNFYFYFFFVIV